MCARFSLYATPAQIAQLLEIEVPEFAPHYNIAPTDVVLGAIERDGERLIREFRWGLIPSWAKDAKIGAKMINARAETVKEKFRNSFQRRRCVIPANGFFEWKHETVEEVKPPSRGSPSLFDEFEPMPRTRPRTLKQPFFVCLKSGEPFAFAGLYEYWHGDAVEKVRSCTILTTRPNKLISPLHDRMPVILLKPDLEAWLNCEDGVEPAQALLQPLPASEMLAIPVSSLVNNPRNDVPEVLTRMS